MAAKYLDSTGVLSPDKKYRYTLGRMWELAERDGDTVAFIMLNPSTADAKDDDATIRRCVGFAKSWGKKALVVVNLFAYRATDPAELKRATDPVGPDNDYTLRITANMFPWMVAAWGDHGTFRQRDLAVRRMLKDLNVPLFHLGLTAAGNPKHPVRLAGASQLVEWK